MTPRRREDKFTNEDMTALQKYRARRAVLGLCSVHGCVRKKVNATHCDEHRLEHNLRMKEWMHKKKGVSNDKC